ncbi:MAG: succinate dehydrogenase, cytochrome b556 subunit [Alphaproteobacteria bacterium]
MSSHERPLSPHLQVYRPQFTSALSILHRLTGVALAFGTILLVYWLLAAAAGEARYDEARALIGSWLGRLVLFGWTFALFYHLLNGIRHLFWDAGLGFDLKRAALSGWAVVIGSVTLTAVAWCAGYALKGTM